MFCKNCGMPTEGDQTLCSKCAAENVQIEQSVQAQGEDTFALYSAAAEAEVPAKKAPRKATGWIIAAALVVALALCVVFSWNFISAFIGRTFQAPEDYLATVESDAVAEYTADLTKAYGKFLDRCGSDATATDAEIGLTIGDDILSLLETTLQQEGVNMELDWLSRINLSVSANFQDTLMQAGLGVGLGNQDLLSADMIVDMKTGMSYVAVPELSEEYLSVDVSSEIDMDEFSQIFAFAMELNKDLAKELPSEAEMNKLIGKYVDIALDGIDNVEKSSDTVSVDGVSQKMVVLTAKITAKDMLEIAEEMLEEAEDDKTIKKIFTALSNYANATGAMGDYYGQVDLYQQFQAAIPDMLEGISYSKESVDSSNYIKLKVYVDNQNAVRGHELTVYTGGEKSMDTISWLTVAKGNKVYTEADLGQVQITGEKEEKRGVSNGFYELTVEGQQVGTLKFIDKTEESGTLRLIPSEEIMSQALADSGIPASLLGDNVGLELAYGEDSLAVGVVIGSKTLVGVELSGKNGKGGSVSVPSGTVDVNDSNALMQWVKNADFEGVLDSLESAGLPAEYVSAARSYVSMIRSYLG